MGDQQESISMKEHSEKQTEWHLVFLMEEQLTEGTLSIKNFLTSFLEALNQTNPNRVMEFFAPHAQIDSWVEGSSKTPAEYKKILSIAWPFLKAVSLVDVCFIFPDYRNPPGKIPVVHGKLYIIYTNGWKFQQDCTIFLQKHGGSYCISKLKLGP